jgi:apolipoprotein N-acyltransferase
LFDWFTRGLADKGAQILVNITNDSWYGTWEQPYQHLYMTLARAVEVRRPLVRATNTGISAVALASGEILPLSPVHQAWQHAYEVPYRIDPERTVFTRWGYLLFPWLLGLGLLGLAFWREKL